MNNEKKLEIVRHLKSLIGQTHQNGINDCNLTFLELYYPEFADKIRGKYSTDKEGFRVAKELLGYRCIHELLDKDDNWYESDSEFASFGDVFINRRSVVICLGNYSFLFDEDDVYRQVNTIQVQGTLYKRK